MSMEEVLRVQMRLTSCFALERSGHVGGVGHDCVETPIEDEDRAKWRNGTGRKDDG